MEEEELSLSGWEEVSDWLPSGSPAGLWLSGGELWEEPEEEGAGSGTGAGAWEGAFPPWLVL